jgi:hypothetical protein
MVHKALLVIPSVFFASVPLLTYAQGFVPLSTDAGSLGLDATTGMQNFLNTLFGISVAVSAILAVIMITIGGFKYMTSESVFKTSSAKENIQGAIFGLIIVLAAILILEVINPDIVSLNLFSPPTP